MWQRRLLTFAVVLAVAFGTANLGRADVRLTELHLERQGTFTALVIPVPGRVLCNHFTEEAKDGKPFRVVLDLCGTVHQLGQKNFGNLPSTVVTRVRTSQYATTPQNVVRVVLDLAGETTYKVASDEQAVTVSLIAPSDAEFNLWSTSASPTPPQSVQAANAAPQPAKDDKVNNPVSSPSLEVASTSAAVTQPATGETKNEPVATQPEPSKPRTDATSAPTMLVPPVRQYDAPAGPPWVEAAATAPATAEQFIAPPVQNTASGTPPLVNAPPQSGSAGTFSPTSAVRAQQEEKLPLLVRLRKKFVGGPGEGKTTVDASTDSAALARIRELAALVPSLASSASEDSTAAAGNPRRTIDRAELESKIASAEPSAVPPGSAIAVTEGEPAGEGAENPEGERGSPVQIELSRGEVTYDVADNRDPFKPLVEGQRSGLWTSSLPRVDALRLVGILQDYSRAMALFEDMEGYGYILSEGDPVKNGFLLTIGTNRVVFQVDDYGWVHTVALEMREDASNSKRGYVTEP